MRNNMNVFFRNLFNNVLENVLEEINKSFDNCEDDYQYSDENLIANKEIYLDTSSLMCKEADMFFLKAVPLLEKYGKKINTLSCCIREINKHLNCDDYDKYHKALEAKKRIEKLNKSGLLNVINYSNDVFADADFISFFNKRRIKEEVMFITQDGNLSVDVYKLNELQSVNGNDIVVKTIGKDGDLIINHKLEEYIDEDEDDYDYEDEGYNIINNNSGGVNISAHRINEINIINNTDEEINIKSSIHDRNKRNDNDNFWFSIY